MSRDRKCQISLVVKITTDLIRDIKFKVETKKIKRSEILIYIPIPILKE